MSDDCGEGEDEATGQCKEYHRYTLEDNSWKEWFEQGENGVDDDFDWTLWSGSTETLGELYKHISNQPPMLDWDEMLHVQCNPYF